MSQDDDDEKKLVGVRIKESRRKKWKAFIAESPEYSSMAEMMRTGVNKIINEERDGNDELMHDKVDTMLERQTRIIEQMIDFRDENKRLFDNIDDARDIADEIVFIQEQMNEGDEE